MDDAKCRGCGGFVPLSLAYGLNYVGAALVVSQLNRVFGGKRNA